MSYSKIFVIEDDDWYAEFLKYSLSLNPENEVRIFKSGKEAINELNSKPDIIILDFSLPDYKGDKLLAKILELIPSAPVIVVSGQEDISVAANLLRNGAHDYIVKDEQTKDILWNSITKIKAHIELERKVDELKSEIITKYEFSNVIKGNSDAMHAVFKKMERAINTNIVVSVTGETGTGKELVAKSIHYNSKRKKQSFVAVNIAAVPESLIESELFGYEKGAFTGANARRGGKFEDANKGTLFLDEIGEMSLVVQAKLLRVLQEREFTRIGGNEIVKTDFKLIIATNKDLAEEVKVGRFREDLYYRLLGLPIELPPLRDRENDVILLTKHFIDVFCNENELPRTNISNSAIKKLKSYSFPGNVRELKAVIDLAIVMADNNNIEENDIRFHSINPYHDLLKEETSLKQYNAMIVDHFLEKYDNDVLLVAKKLQIGKSTIYRMLKSKL